MNHGVARSTNDCLGDELTWAGGSAGTTHPAVDLYVNGADPTANQATRWPTDDHTFQGKKVTSPYGSCDGTTTRACSWVYGASIAQEDLDTPGLPASVGRWWIDIEGGSSGNTWSETFPARNRAAVEGMVASFAVAKQRVGLYAGRSEFQRLIGAVPTSSRLSALPSWIAGAADLAHARAACSSAPLTRGRVLLVQWEDTAAHVDHDVACALLPAASRPTVGGSKRVGVLQTARTGTAHPATLHLAYRWTRNGHTIGGATHRTYRLRTADAGHRIAVQVTATAAGCSRSIRTSRSYAVRP